MLNKEFKLIATAVGLVAVLALGLAVPGATQQNPLTRANVVNAINNAVAATLTAAEGDVFDTDNAKFYSDTKMAWSYIPLHLASRSIKFLELPESVDKLLRGEDLNVTIAAFYLPEDIRSFLKAGVYTLKLVNRFKAVLVSQEGSEIFTASVKLDGKDRFDTRACPMEFTVRPNGRITIKIFCICEIIISF